MSTTFADRESRLVALGAATLYEAAGRRGAVDPDIAALSVASIAGRALPVRCHPGDNLAIHHAVAMARDGDILVVQGHGVRVGYLGDVLAEAALVRNAKGAIVDGGVRDLTALSELGFGVWARGPAIAGAAKASPGEVGAPVVCGGVLVARGDWIVADTDGVVVIPDACLEAALEAADRRVHTEARMRERIRQGESTTAIMGLPSPHP